MNYDLSGFHKGHKKTPVGSPEGLFIYCDDCGIMANVEEISAKILPAEAVKTTGERIVYGKQSAGCDKGASK